MEYGQLGMDYTSIVISAVVVFLMILVVFIDNFKDMFDLGENENDK